MSTPLNALTFLGSELLHMYQEKHKAVTPETEVVKLDWQSACLFGYRIRLYEPQSILDTNLTFTSVKELVIAPTEFELWALSKNGPFFKLAYEPTTKCIYGVKL